MSNEGETNFDFQPIYESQEQIPENMRSLYRPIAPDPVNSPDKTVYSFHGMLPPDSVIGLKKTLHQVYQEKDNLNKKLKTIVGDKSPDDFLREINELKSGSSGKKQDKDLEQSVEGLRSLYERKIQEEQERYKALEQEKQGYVKFKQDMILDRSIRDAAKKAGVPAERADILVTLCRQDFDLDDRDSLVNKNGIENIHEWFDRQKQTNSFLWGETVGGGSMGSNGKGGSPDIKLTRAEASDGAKYQEAYEKASKRGGRVIVE